MTTQAELHKIVQSMDSVRPELLERYYSTEALHDYKGENSNPDLLLIFNDDSCMHCTNANSDTYESVEGFMDTLREQGPYGAHDVMPQKDESVTDWYKRWSHAAAIAYGWITVDTATE